MMFVEGILYVPWEVHMCTGQLSSVMDPWIIPSMDTQMLYSIVASGEASTHTHHKWLRGTGCSCSGPCRSDHICTGSWCHLCWYWEVLLELMQLCFFIASVLKACPSLSKYMVPQGTYALVEELFNIRRDDTNHPSIYAYVTCREHALLHFTAGGI